MPRYDFLQECCDIDLHTPQLLENAAGQVVQPGKDVDQQDGGVDADLQPMRHEIQHGPELLVLVVETLTQTQGGDDVGDCIADERCQIDTRRPCFLNEALQLCFNHGQAFKDARLQTQLAKAEAAQSAVTELTVCPPQRTVGCKHDPCEQHSLQTYNALLFFEMPFLILKYYWFF